MAAPVWRGAGGIAGLRRFLTEYGEAVEWDMARYWPGRSLLELYRGTLSWRELRVFLKYGPRGERVITGLERVSRPGRRVYFGRDDVPDVLAGLGTSILTTSRGVMTGREATKAGVGGEVLCNVW